MCGDSYPAAFRIYYCLEVLSVNTPISPLGDKSLISPNRLGEKRDQEQGESFGSTLKKFVEDVNSLQNQMDTKIEKLATGEITDVHEVMIAVENANTAMEFMLEIRNKIVEAYQEVMRMPV